MEGNVTIDQLKAAADSEGNVTIRFQYPSGWAKVRSYKDGDLKTMHYQLAAIFIGNGVASMNLEAPQPEAPEVPEAPKAIEPVQTTIPKQKKATKKQ